MRKSILCMTIVIAMIITGKSYNIHAAAVDTQQISDDGTMMTAGVSDGDGQQKGADETQPPVSDGQSGKNGLNGENSLSGANVRNGENAHSGENTQSMTAGVGSETSDTSGANTPGGTAGESAASNNATSGNTDPTVPEDPTGGALLLQKLLTTDDENIYEGMDRAYKDGYAPMVGNGIATIVLPLCTDASVDIPSIKVIPDLGATQGSPFVFKNYQKTIKKAEEKINGTEDVRIVYLVKFELELQEGYTNGVYPVILNIAYTYQGASMTQAFTTYIQLTDGKSAEPETQPPVAVEKPEDPTSEPKVILSKCTGLPDKIESGDTFSLIAVLKNTNKLKSVQNMTVTVTCPSEGLSLQADSNVFYFDHLASQASLELPLSFRSDEKAVDGKYTITLAMFYDNPDAVSLSSEGNIEVHIRQKLDVALEVGAAATEVNAGDSMTLSVQAMNLGRGKIYNARCQIQVPGLTAEKSLFLGNMDGGSAASGELSLFASMVNPQAKDDKERYGKTMGSVELIYEDEQGNEYTVEEAVSLTINPLKINASLNTKDDTVEGIGNQLLIGIGALALFIAVGTAVPVLLRRKRRRAGYEGE